MNNEDRKQIQTIIREAQYKINSLCSGYRVLLIEAERTEADIQSDVTQALRDREALGLSANNNVEVTAPATLDNVDAETRDLIERSLQESSGLEGGAMKVGDVRYFNADGVAMTVAEIEKGIVKFVWIQSANGYGQLKVDLKVAEVITHIRVL